ncbi:hypothetical protein F2P79_014032 [Pimephales promelas]|nr:hypothetical protein F2P79_014032 [Pimephales promelas]
MSDCEPLKKRQRPLESEHKPEDAENRRKEAVRPDSSSKLQRKRQIPGKSSQISLDLWLQKKPSVTRKSSAHPDLSNSPERDPARVQPRRAGSDPEARRTTHFFTSSSFMTSSCSVKRKVKVTEVTVEVSATVMDVDPESDPNSVLVHVCVAVFLVTCVFGLLRASANLTEVMRMMRIRCRIGSIFRRFAAAAGADGKALSSDVISQDVTLADLRRAPACSGSLPPLRPADGTRS